MKYNVKDYSYRLSNNKFVNIKDKKSPECKVDKRGRGKFKPSESLDSNMVKDVLLKNQSRKRSNY